MDRLAGYDRTTAIGWRLLIAAAATLTAIRIATSGHSVTALLFGLAALLAMADIVIAKVRPDRSFAAAPSDLSAAREADRLRALLDAVSAALFVIDSGGRIVFANRAARRLANGEITRLDDIATLGPAAIAAVRALPAGGRRIVRAQDGRNLLAWSGSFTVPGEVPQRLLSLQWVVGELDAVETEAWHAMTRVLTHEMMNSLTPIVSLAESVAALNERDAAAGPALATIARRSKHLLRFIERYRALGDLPPPLPVTFDLAMLLIDIANTIQPEFASAGIDLSVQIDSVAAMVTADPDLVERAVTNLLRNAAEALRDCGTPKVVLTLSANRDGRSIMIRDNGPGIPEDRRDEIFVPFFTTKPGGSGIGLPLARHIALLHGGTLVVTPVIPGSCFEFYLPYLSVSPASAEGHLQS
jgi:signal transduction histidine kinase